MNFKKQFDQGIIDSSQTDAKIGLLSTISPEGYPHISLITSVTANKDNRLTWGQFSRGLSKQYIKKNKKTGFLILNVNKQWWSGKSTYIEEQHKGEIYEFFNNKPMFRYNAYFGIGAVHIQDLIDVSDANTLSVMKIFIGQMKSKALKKYIKTNDTINSLPQYAIDLAKPVDALKFLSFIDDDGYPRMIPTLQAKVLNSNYIGVSHNTNPEIIDAIPDGAKVGMFICNFNLISLLIQGTWMKNKNGGVVKVDKLYNSMLPTPRYIYPHEPIPNVYGSEVVKKAKLS